jgi:hypothetical protein
VESLAIPSIAELFCTIHTRRYAKPSKHKNSNVQETCQNAINAILLLASRSIMETDSNHPIAPHSVAKACSKEELRLKPGP